ncbi:hypothetical protein ACJJTC_015247 [Scirpophaga incertulas]
MSLKYLKSVRGLVTSARNVSQVCIVGAGTAGFYAAMHLTKNMANINIDILEKLPVPFGLVRYGVAPDHPEVKNVINHFTKVACHPNVNFYGNVTLGKHVSLHQLRLHYDAVLLAYGADEDKTLNIENEEASNVIAARNFVGWYNGFPYDNNLKIDLSGTTAAVLGQGNVALDIARILMTPIDNLRKTDITEHALCILAESKIKELYLIGRRGPLQVAFTIKELREQLKLENCRTLWRKQDFKGVEEILVDLPRPRKRLTELMLKSLKESQEIESKKSDCKYFKPIFFRTPKKFLASNDNVVNGIELHCTELVGEKLEDLKCVPNGDNEIIECNVAFRSIGYKSISVDKDIELTSHGILANEKGIVTDNNTLDHLGKLYVAGWLGTGPVGVILHTMGNAFQVAKLMCDELKMNANTSSKGGFNEISKIIQEKNNEIVDWKGWEKIDNYEIGQGKSKGKPREKVCTIKKMIEIALQ